MSAEVKDRITAVQATIILANYTIAAGIITLPRTIVEASETPDVWISVFLGGVITFLTGLIIVKLSQRFPGQTIFQFSGKIIGKPLGAILSILVVFYFLCIASFEVRSVQEVTSFFLLEGTPPWAIVAIFIWIAFYLCRGGLNAITSMCRLIVPITWTVFVGVCLLSIEVFDIDNLRPFLGDGLGPVWKGIRPTILTFTAGEAMLFVVAFMDKPQKAVKVIIAGTCISTFFYLLAVVMTIGAFSIDGVVTRTWPFLDLVRSFEVNYLIFERFESLLLVIWIMQIFCTFCITIYAAALGVSQIFHKRFNSCLLAILPVAYVVSRMPPNVNALFALGTVVGNWMIVLFGLIPLPLLIIAHFRRAAS
ncbi:spore gernimation protein [Paenibacillus odorifer]|jgi:spore germination protein|uniref:GerAB/ArcD/ProY family transporter n=1 Tax=Paenibacillus TaxID=44249 RepID=UPI00096C4997|nr:GerAB/ArcD/ProY family transporter [Paenibacillus odorifer]OMD57351.1 spore gernimation protein [Paenibacillus odorifer]OMD92476.1 spore gernimation protein [Paenibacillus odorifer]OME43244.1 spore gernimation protein [Paenibacillus odorifer]